MQRPNILIVGAGPVGLTAAIELKRRGFHPRIIDRAEGPAGESRAFGIHARTLEIFQPAGITETLLKKGNKVRGAVIGDDHGPFLRLDFSLVQQKYNFVLILPQSETERVLLSALQKSGVEVQWRTALEDFQVHQEHIDCRIEYDAEPAPYDIVIGCDGAHSTVREKLGIGFHGQTYPHDWQLADVRFRGTRPADQLRVKTVAPDILAYFPLSANSGRFVGSTPDLLEAIEKEVDVDEVLWQSNFRIAHRIVESYQKGRVFLAGDAAHIHSPIGGRGMNLGIEDAATLAWLIETDQTQRYTSMRKPIGQSVLQFTNSQTRQLTSTNPVLRFALRRVGPLVMKSTAMQRFAFRRISGANTPKPPWLSSQS